MGLYQKQYIDKVGVFLAEAASQYKKIFPIEFSNLRVEADDLRITPPDISNIKTFENTKLAKDTLTASIIADISIYKGGKRSSSKKMFI